MEINNKFLIVGLGNFGEKYSKNRHNAGFLILDFLLEKLKKIDALNVFPEKISSNFEFLEQKKFFGSVCKISYKDQNFFFLKPLTFMNLSGKSACALKNFYKIDLKNVFVVHDELDFQPFKAKFKDGGGNGGHNGLKSLTSAFGSCAYLRLRAGIGKPDKDEIQISDHVLSDLSQTEIKFLEKIGDFLGENFFDLFAFETKKKQKIFQKISEL